MNDDDAFRATQILENAEVLMRCEDASANAKTPLWRFNAAVMECA